MASSWWYQCEEGPGLGRVEGPIELSRLAELIQTGDLPNELLVSRNGELWEVLSISNEVQGALLEDREAVVREYLRYAAAPPGEEDWGWAGDCMNYAIRRVPEVAWELTNRLIDAAPDEDALGFFAAALLEDLLAEHGPEFIGRVEERSRQNPKFLRAVRMLRQPTMTGEVWRRVLRVAEAGEA
jgi:hypothetical protein